MQRASTLALLVSSWLGGHWSEASEEEARAESAALRTARRSNVVMLGDLRRGGQRPRALLFKLLHDDVLAPVDGASCELRRSRSGTLECRIYLAAPLERERVDGAPVEAAPESPVVSTTSWDGDRSLLTFCLANDIILPRRLEAARGALCWCCSLTQCRVVLMTHEPAMSNAVAACDERRREVEECEVC